MTVSRMLRLGCFRPRQGEISKSFSSLPTAQSTDSKRLACVPAPITHFIPFEMGNLVEMIRGIGLLAALRHRPFIAVIGMETVVYVTVEAVGPVKPWTSADEYAAGEPFGAVIAVRGAGVGRDVIVAVGTIRSHADFDADLSRPDRGGRESDSNHSS